MKIFPNPKLLTENNAENNEQPKLSVREGETTPAVEKPGTRPDGKKFSLLLIRVLMLNRLQPHLWKISTICLLSHHVIVLTKIVRLFLFPLSLL